MKRRFFGIAWFLKRKVHIKTFLHQMLDKLVYQVGSRDVLRHHSNRQRARAVLFYNYAGRFMLALRETTALFTNNVIFKKSIKLEDYDDVDLNALYEYGESDVVWPKSPFVETDLTIVEDDVYEKIEKSYRLAYEGDHHKFPLSKWWQDMSQQFRDHFFDEKGHILRDRLMNFRGEKSSDAAILSDQLQVISKDDGYIKSYLNAIDMVTEYHRYAQVVKNEVLASISESQAGNNLCPVYRGKRISSRLLTYALYLSGILENVEFSKTERNVTVDIGGGYGGLERLLALYVPNSCHVIVELPEVAVFASYFLSYCFPDKKIAFLDDVIDRMDRLDEVFREYDFVVLPSWCIEAVPEKSVKLVINTTSLGEMSREYGRFYLENIDRILQNGGFFYSVNRLSSDVDKYDDFGFFKWSFQERYLTVSYRYLPVGYPQWVGRKIDSGVG